MQIDAYEEGVPSWVDVACPDLQAGRAFYSALFGWDIVEGPPEAGGYSVAFLKERTVAGVGPQMNPAAPPAWTNYVNVASADTSAEAVVEHGGTLLVAPMDVLDVGRMAIFADPSGAVLGLWQPGTHFGAGLVNELHTWCWSELVTPDVDQAKVFYRGVFGWDAESHGDGPRDYVVWTLRGRGIAGMLPKPPDIPAEVPPFWNAYFTVADADAAAKEIVRLGGTIVQEPMDVEPGRIVVAQDVGGATFGVIRFAEMPD